MKLLKFTDGEDVYKDFNTKYKRHKKGYIILGPPGIGKTTFIKNQKGKKKDWIDADHILGYKSLNITKGDCDFNNHKNCMERRLCYMRADYMLEQSRCYGFRIIGALFWEYKADAVVIPPLKQHKLYAESRKDLDLNKIKNMRKIFLSHARKYKIPVFQSINDAANHLEKM